MTEFLKNVKNYRRVLNHYLFISNLISLLLILFKEIKLIYWEMDFLNHRSKTVPLYQI